MATKTVVTRSTVADDEKRLRTVLTTFLDVPNFDTHQTEYDAHEIVLALKEQGITPEPRIRIPILEPLLQFSVRSSWNL